MNYHLIDDGMLFYVPLLDDLILGLYYNFTLKTSGTEVASTVIIISKANQQTKCASYMKVVAFKVKAGYNNSKSQ